MTDTPTTIGRISPEELDLLLGLLSELRLARNDLEDLKTSLRDRLPADLYDRFTSAVFRITSTTDKLKDRLVRLRPEGLVQALLVTTDETVLGLPLADVAETFLLPAAESLSFPLDHNGLTVLSLHTLWTGQPHPPSTEPVPCVRLSLRDRSVGLAVSRILREESLLSQPLDPVFLNHPLIASAALLGEGRPVFLLDTSRILQTADT